MVPKDPIVARFEQAQDALVLQASDLSLETIAAMVESNAIDVRPEFQRRERWDSARASALIESFLLNIPVPPVYLAETDFGQYSVIDGKQRITAINNFMRDRLPLGALSRFFGVDGKRFSDLPRPLQNALTVRPYIRVISILRQSDDATKYEVFHRLNSGGEPLNAQEIRNVIYRGRLNDLLVDLSANKFLRLRLKITNDRASLYRTMADVEFVLRFLTLREQWKTFSGDFRKSMDTFMQTHQNPTESQLRDFRVAFETSLTTCEALWGQDSFKRLDFGNWRDQMLAGMYDAQMIAVDRLSKEQRENLMEKKRAVSDATSQLFADFEFESAVRVATNTPSKLEYRVNAVYTSLISALAAK